MTIADEIAKEFAKNLAERRAAARQQLVSAAADAEELIRSKRPQKSEEKSIVEEAHPGEVFVAESDGLGGMVGNLEQVREQILNALNRRPSAFPYQGLVANAMLDFQKTAETLESHDLHDEADAVRKIAQDLLAVLQRRANIAAPPGTPVGPEIELGSPSPTSPPPPLRDIAQEADILPTPASSPESAAPAMRTVAKQGEKAKSAVGRLKGVAGKIALPLGAAIELASAVDAARSGDWGSLWTSAGGAALGAAARAAGITSAPAIAAAVTGSAIATGIKSALVATSQDGIDEDLAELAADLRGEMDDESYKPDAQTDPEKKIKAARAAELLATMLDRINRILGARDAIRAEASKSADQMDPAIAGIAIQSIVTSNRELATAFTEFEKIGSELDLSFLRETLGFGYPKIKNRISDVNESVSEFESAMEELYQDIKPQVDAIRDQLKRDEARAAELMKGVASGAISGYEARKELGSTTKLVSDADDPGHIKDTQNFLGVPETGKWDAATMDKIMEIRNRWIGFHIDMAKHVTEDVLKASTRKELEDLERLWSNRLVGN